MTEKELPEGYWIDESGVDIIVLYYLTEELGKYTHNAETIVFDAQEHAKTRGWTNDDELDHQVSNIGAM